MLTSSDHMTDLSNAHWQSNSRSVVTGEPQLKKLMTSVYGVDQQVKYLHLQAEVESLWQHQQLLKQQRLVLR
ncbi:MAG: hypothetical protein F6J98_09950 [Moorea sp. SIO4G2]|uniref:hypothetical protein n=1 Tax=unclassified Moorena TaxID=2683338 RepID=UPI0013F6D3C5|nr:MULTISPECIES: hypothetical protein [unclassified Moorena]NEO13047.1 hypothetical protein [Moorena sp. SIO3E8]NEO60735.1 hypothetical protein [Moorena sp. SIO4G2]NEQ00262.1 hypothetical protein [Moorena sp. SIO3F7]